ncbi:MAG TPA: Lrp/AsnC family transcriptional regulator [Cytophagales bacterium]|nr:Lrp/AsnC family transcriptional regulator [Cytophagales bacterium]
MAIKLDSIDRKILHILQDNGNITNAQLAKEVGLSPAPTLERVKKLEQSGVIQSYHAELCKEKIGIGVSIFVLVTLSSHKMNQINSFVEKINGISEVIECHHITGRGDFLLKILTKDIPSYQGLILDTLSQIEEIGNMQSMVNLNTYKSSKILPILV